MLEPYSEFMERHGLLVAHCFVSTKSTNVPVRVLNPSPVPVTIYQSERVGQLQPVDAGDDAILCAGVEVANTEEARKAPTI